MTVQKLYKLTDKEHRTRNNTQWGLNITHKIDGKGNLCGPGWLHAYTSPLLAVLLNPIHGQFEPPILWEARGIVGKTDNGLQVGCTELTTIKTIPLPNLTLDQKIDFSILCALAIYKDKNFKAWANSWLSHTNRTFVAASAAVHEAHIASHKAYADKSDTDEFAANAGAFAASAATYSARTTSNVANAIVYTAYVIASGKNLQRLMTYAYNRSQHD